MFDTYKDFFLIWSDTFFKFFLAASNDDRSLENFFVCPTQDTDPNNLA